MRAIKSIKRVTATTLLLFGMSIPFTATAVDISAVVVTNPADSGSVDGSPYFDVEHNSATSLVNAGGTITDVVGNTVSVITRYA